MKRIRTWIQNAQHAQHALQSRRYSGERFLTYPAFKSPYSDCHVNNDARLEALWSSILESGKRNIAAQVVEEWTRAGNVPSKNLMTNILLRLCFRSRFKDAHRLGKWLDYNRAYDLSETDKLLRLDIVCHLGPPWGQAQERFKGLSNKDETAYVVLLEGYCDAMALLPAEALMKEMVESKLITSARPYSAMLRMYVRSGRHQKAVQTFEVFEASGFDPDPKMLALMLRHSDTTFKTVQVAKKAAVAAQRMKLNHDNRRELMRLNAYLGNLSSVERNWRDTKSLPPVIPGDYLAAINAYDLLGQVKKAEEVSAELQKESPKQLVTRDHWLSMLRMYARHGLMEQAELVLSKMTVGVENDFLLCHPLVEGYLKQQDIDKALQCFYKFADGTRPTKLVVDCMVQLLQVLVKRGDVQAAEELVAKVPEISAVPVYNLMLRLYTTASEFQKAVELKQKMFDSNVPMDVETRMLLQEVQRLLATRAPQDQKELGTGGQK